MSYRDLLAEIKKGLPSPAYVLVSSDPFLHAEATVAVRQLVPEAEMDFNFHVFDLAAAGQTSFEQLLDVLNTMPFFAGRKFVVLDNVQKLLKKDLKKLELYLSAPSASSVAVMLYAGQPKKEAKESLKTARHIVLDISERDIRGWLTERARQRGIALTQRAADYLIDIIGPDLGLLASEVEKCGLIDAAAVDVDDIREVVEGKRTYNAFALIDAIRMRDSEKAFRIYKVLRETEEPYALLGALNWQYARSFAEKKTPRDQVYYANVFGMLKEADLQIKSSGGAYPMELLLVKLMQLSKQR